MMEKKLLFNFKCLFPKSKCTFQLANIIFSKRLFINKRFLLNQKIKIQHTYSSSSVVELIANLCSYSET